MENLSGLKPKDKSIVTVGRVLVENSTEQVKHVVVAGISQMARWAIVTGQRSLDKIQRPVDIPQQRLEPDPLEHWETNAKLLHFCRGAFSSAEALKEASNTENKVFIHEAGEGTLEARRTIHLQGTNGTKLALTEMLHPEAQYPYKFSETVTAFNEDTMERREIEKTYLIDRAGDIWAELIGLSYIEPVIPAECMRFDEAIAKTDIIFYHELSPGLAS